jgi:Protein of unknown function (DUF1838)
MRITRRTLILTATIAAGAGVNRSWAAERPGASLLATYQRLRGAPKGGLALWWYTGNVWGKTPDDVARVYFKVSGLTYQRLTPNANGTLTQAMAGRGFYADPDTGQPLQTWVNPLTTEPLDPPHVKSHQVQQVSLDGQVTRTEDKDSLLLFEGGLSAPVTEGDSIWQTENYVAKTKRGDARNATQGTTSSLTTFTARIADVMNARADFVPCYLNYQSLGSWPAWMKMGDRPGILSWQTYGHKVRAADVVAGPLRPWIEARHPGFLSDPGI